MNTQFNVSDQELAAATGGWGFLAKLFAKKVTKKVVQKGAKRVAMGGISYGAWEGGQQAVRAATGNNSETDA